MTGRTHMSAQDALWLTMDRPNNLMVIDGTMVLAESPGLDAVVDVVQERIVDRFPVFRRRPVKAGNGWVWVDDPDFDVHRHVHVARLKGKADMAALQRFMSEQRAKALPKTRPLWTLFLVERVVLDDGRDGAAIVARFHHAMADGVRLTQVMLSMCDVDRIAVQAKVSRANGTGVPAPGIGGAAAAARTTAASVVDAVSAAIGRVDDVTRAAVGAAGSVAGSAAGAVAGAVADPGAALAAVPGAVAALPGTVVRAVGDLVRTGAESIEDVMEEVVEEGAYLVRRPDRLVDVFDMVWGEENRVLNDVSSVTKLLLSAPSVRTVWSGTPGHAKAIAWTPPLRLKDVKDIGRAEGATVNDVLLNAVAGGLRRYVHARGGDVREVLWMVPVNLRPFEDNLPEELGNYFSLVLMPMPLDEPQWRPRLQEIHQRMLRIKHSDEAVLTFGVQQTISQSPREISVFFTNFFANKAVGVLTNVPGPASTMHFAGARVVQVVGFAPCSGDQPMTATIFSFDGTVTVGFATDAGLVPDPEELARLVAEETARMHADVRRVSAAPAAAR